MRQDVVHTALKLLVNNRLSTIELKTVKTLKCDLCDITAAGETFEAWMKALMPHYMQAHADVMNNPSKTKEDQQKWMVENKTRFEAA